ncbi:MAG: sugar phosphate nucleotidyltransferase [Rickettsiales bacterium]|jgi:mannose-1-phosphate guanylyltransferase|nr:sugar phosphate nucleotidyltransferase [Rickettsiales bacterium]
MQPNVVLLAGGCGERLWPLSSAKHPKQFITLPSVNISSFQLSLKRSLSITSSHNIIIVANVDHQRLLCQQISDLDLDYNDFDIILEKYSNNTGVAVYYACLLLLQKKNYNLTYFFPTDHLMYKENDFFEKVLFKMAPNRINLFAKRVSNPCSNFGYIVVGESISSNYYKIEKFIEKPGYKEIETLKQNNQNLYMNLGIYLATASVLYDEFNKFHKNLPSIIFNLKNNKHEVLEIYNNAPIDKMISENSKILNLLEVVFEWKDIGSIESLYQYCAGRKLSCKINPMHITEFNDRNKEFELSGSEDSVQIIKR